MNDDGRCQGNSRALELIFSNSPLPVMNTQVPRLLQAVMNQDWGLDQLSGIVEQFPSIAMRLIYLANSPWSSPTNPISSVRDACARLGFNTVRTVSIGLAVASPLNPSRCPLFDIRRYWASALLMAETVDLLLPHLKRPETVEPPIARTAALLSNFGLLCMADRLPVETNAAFDRKKADASLSLLDAQRALAGTDYCQVGACIAEHWGLPTPLPEAMAHHRDPDYQGPGSAAVALAGTAYSLVSHGFEQNRETEAIAWTDTLKLARQERARIITRVSERVLNACELAKTLF